MVLLNNELIQLEHLITLEQEKKESCIYIEMQVTGDISNRYVAPMVLVKMLEQVITHLYDAEIFSCFAQLKLIAENNVLSSTFIFSDVNETTLLKANWELIIAYTRNMLNNYYTPSDFNIELINHKKGNYNTASVKAFRIC